MADLPIEQLLNTPLVDPGRHLDLGRVRRYSQLLDEMPPVTVFRLEDQTLLLVDGYHRVAAAQATGRVTVRPNVRGGTRAEAVKFATRTASRAKLLRPAGSGSDQAPQRQAVAGGGALSAVDPCFIRHAEFPS